MNKLLFVAAVPLVAFTLMISFGFISFNFSPNTSIAQVPPSPPPAQGGPAGWTDDGTVVRLTTTSDLVGIGTNAPSTKLEVIGDISLSGFIDGIDLSLKALDWNTAFNERRQWDGGSANLNPVNGRTSLSLNSLKVNDVNSVNGVVFKDSDGPDCHKVTVNSAGALSTIAVNCISGEPISGIEDNFDSYSSGTLDGKNGGTGFSATWVKNNTGDFDIKTNSCQSGNCIADNSGGDTRNYRVFPTQVSGAGGFYIKRTQNQVNNFEIAICPSLTTNCESGLGVAKFRFAIPRLSPFNVVLKSGETDVVLGQYGNLTWQKIEFEWGAGQSQGCVAGEVVARFAGGAWSGCKVMNIGNDPGTINLVTDDTAIGGADEFWIDELEL